MTMFKYILIVFLALIPQIGECQGFIIGHKPDVVIVPAPTSVPDTPALVSPTNGRDSVSCTPDFVWGATDSTDSYTLNVATDTGFTSLVTNITVTVAWAGAWTVLDSGAVYYWRVKATNVVGSSPWSPYWSFTTIEGSVPGAPSLVSPADLAVDVSVTPTLSWSATATASSYNVQLSLSSGFVSTILDSTLSATSVAPDTLSYTTQYYWRVKATNSWGSGPYTSRSFTTTSAPDTTKVYAGDYHVRIGGSDDSAGTTYAKAWATIAKANANAASGDTVVFYAGTYVGSIAPANSGLYPENITYTTYASDLVRVVGDATYGDGNSLNLYNDYIKVQGFTFVDSARASTTADWYWGLIGGDHNTLTRCRFVDDQDTTDYFSGGVTGRLLYAYGKYTTIENSYFRGGYHGIVIDGAAPRYYNFNTDTVHNTGYIGIVLGGGSAIEGVSHSGIVQNCHIDTCGEDNIQLQNNGVASELANSGIIIKNNYFGNARENCIDVKATGATICIEDNTMVLSRGNDTNEDNAGVDNHSGGAGIELGAGDYSQYVISRFNTILANHGGSKIYVGGHFFHNTVGANHNSYNGTQDTSVAFWGVQTSNDTEIGTKHLLNNIVFGHSYFTKGSEVYIHKTGGANFHIDHNLYWDSSTVVRYEANVLGSATPLYVIGLSAWQTLLAGANYSSWEGLDANSLEEDPLFTTSPSHSAAYTSSYDVTLQASSPAVGKACALTVATVASTDNPDLLTVDDPYFFRSDYGVSSIYSSMTGDSIVIGSGAAVEVTAIDYTNAILTLSANRSWAVGDSVWLYKNGLKVNDIGAKQR